MHVLAARIGDHNAVVVSQAQLAKIVSRSERAVRMAIKVLKDEHWIEVRQLGGTASVNAYVVNDRVAWHGSRDGLRYSLFSATVLAAEEEQPDRESLGKQAALRRLPDVQPGERQLPSGDGLPPISQPSLLGMEPDLPARRIADRDE